ncbi:MAG: hypothetical protein OEY19_09965 [Gammaproteobacteria bacterium]|nr:hypothetical protein [Gammaproteobacteria bacterium]MDH5629066.1 hypothetical protein [Gammaproteobacteria bacterium]
MIGLMVLTFYFIVYALLFLTIAHFIKNAISRGLIFILFALTPYYLYIYQRNLLEYHCLNTEYIKPVEKVSYPEVIYYYGGLSSIKHLFENTSTKYIVTPKSMMNIEEVTTSKDLIYYDIENDEAIDIPVPDIQISYAINSKDWSQDGFSFHETYILKMSDKSVVSNITWIRDPYARRHIWQYLDLINVGECIAGYPPSEKVPRLFIKLVNDTFI